MTNAATNPVTNPAPSPGPGDRARRAAKQLVESVYELTGGSMSPTLERGWKVLVEPLEAPPEPGDVVLIDGTTGYIVHRCLGMVTLGSPPQKQVVHVIHAGDSPSARPGVVPASRVTGRVRAIVRPDGRRLPALEELPQQTRRRLSRFRSRWELYARLLRLAETIPGLHRLLAGAPARTARRSLGIG